MNYFTDPYVIVGMLTLGIGFVAEVILANVSDRRRERVYKDCVTRIASNELVDPREYRILCPEDRQFLERVCNKGQ